MTRRPTISAIVPAYDAARYLAQSLPPLLALKAAGEIAEVILVDDASSQADGVRLAEQLGARVLTSPSRGGPGKARNLGAGVATGEILWFVDADVVTSASGPATLREALKDPAVVAVFGCYDEHPPAVNFASQYKNLVHRHYHLAGAGEATTFWAGCGAVRQADFTAVGGFDAASFPRPAIEDIELGYRLIDAGGAIRLLPQLECAHLKRWSLGEVVRTDIFQRAVPWSRLLLSRGRRAGSLNLAGPEKLRAILAAAWLCAMIALPVAGFGLAVALVLAVLTAAVGLANAGLFAYFRRLRGLGFALAATLFHQIYYGYSLTVFVMCAAQSVLRRVLAFGPASAKAAGETP